MTQPHTTGPRTAARGRHPRETENNPSRTSPYEFDPCNTMWVEGGGVFTECTAHRPAFSTMLRGESTGKGSGWVAFYQRRRRAQIHLVFSLFPRGENDRMSTSLPLSTMMIIIMMRKTIAGLVRRAAPCARLGSIQFTLERIGVWVIPNDGGKVFARFRHFESGVVAFRKSFARKFDSPSPSTTLD